MAGELEVTLPYVDGGTATNPAVIGRYSVLGSIGGGGMGIVLRGRDAELGRDIAIKVMRPEVGGASLLEREAQAMAKLSHPNVVTIYEVGRFDGRPFIAMELVVGETLRTWLATRHPWRETVAMFVAAGRGLVAAHAEGLVHRDFKPENVLIGRDGRPRVTDFGLVATTATPVHASAITATTTFTTRGGAAGTPAYMAPEQWLGDEIDARADQFAFAVALWEALWGARPFAGDTGDSLRAAVTGDAPPAEVDLNGVPKPIARALRRALARKPDARWPKLQDLLDELERAARGRRLTWLAAGGGASVAVLAGVAIWQLGGSEPELCPVSDRAAAIWSGPVRERIEAHVVAIDPALGRARVAAVADRFNSAVAAWQTAGVEACRANRVAGRDSDSLYDTRVRCLDGWLDELRETVALFEQANDLTAIDRAVVIGRGLSSVDRCSDKVLSKVSPPPPQHRVEADAIQKAVAAAYIARSTGERTTIVETTAKLVERARAIGHAQTLASALRQHAEALIATDDYAKARDVLEETAAVAAKAGDDELTAIAWITAVRVLHAMRRPDEARQLVAVARAAVVRAGNDLAQQVALLNYEASLIGGRGESARALELLEDARKLLVDAGAEKPGSEHADNLVAVLMTTGGAYGNARRFDDSIAAIRRAIDLRKQSYGPDHPDLIDGYLNLAESYRRARRDDEGLEAAREAMRIAEARMPHSPALARSWNRFGRFLLQRNQVPEALAQFEKSIALAKEVAPDNAVLLEGMLGDRALALRYLGRYAEAIAGYDEVIALVEAKGMKTSDPSGHTFNRAGTRKEAGDFEGALLDYRRAREIADRQPPELEYHAVPSLIGEGECLVHLKRPAEAIAPLERALAIKAPPIQARNQPVGRFYLARALAESKRDVPRAIREAFAARAAIIASKTNLDWVEAIDAFVRFTDPKGAYTPK